MITLQKTLITAAFLAVAGTAIYQARQASVYRKRIEILERLQAPLPDEARKLTRDGNRNEQARPALHLPSPSFPVTSLPKEFEDLQSTNLFGRLMKEIPQLAEKQIEPYLQKNRRSAESLLAAFRATGDRKFLLEAMKKYPTDPRVSLSAYYQSAPNNYSDPATKERRQWLDDFKKSDPENALGFYLSARDDFKAGNISAALQELQTAAGKGFLQDYSADSIQNTKEAYRSAGSSEDAATAIASSHILLKQWTELRFLGRDLIQLAGSYSESGDSASAQAALAMVQNLGRQIDQPGALTLVQSTVGIEMQRSAINAMIANAPNEALQAQLDFLNQRTENNRVTQQKISMLLQNLSDQEFATYLDRTLLFGEESARRWVLKRSEQ